MTNTSKSTQAKKHQSSTDMQGLRTALATALSVLIIGVIAFGVVNEPGAHAQGSGGSVTGYAWSDTIGWISMNGSGYGISVSGSGVLSGYAWSDNIGWISANGSDLSGCPSSPCTASIDEDGNLEGWLKAISGGSSQSGGWDGFISLSGSGYGATRQSDGSFSGYAWGDTVVGWLDLRYATTDYLAEPTAELKVRLVGETAWQDGLTIEPTDEIEIGWNQDGSTNTTSCEAVPPTNNFSTGSEVSGIDSDVDEPIGNTSHSYRLLCYGSGDAQAVDTAVVTTNGGVGAQFVPCPGQGSKPDRIRRGANVDVCWEIGTNNPAMCSLKTGGVDVVSPVGSTTTYTHNIIGEVEFNLECTGGDSDVLRVQALIEAQET